MTFSKQQFSVENDIYLRQLAAEQVTRRSVTADSCRMLNITTLNSPIHNSSTIYMQPTGKQNIYYLCFALAYLSVGVICISL